MTDYPEHEKMRRIRDDADTIAHFLEWLEEQPWYICELQEERACGWYSSRKGRRCEGGRIIDDVTHEDLGECESCDGEGIEELITPRFMPTGLGIEKTLARYFDIDLQRISEEKTQMLEEIRAHQG